MDIYLSDVHAGPGLGWWEWLDDKGATRVSEFFDSAAGRGATRVVLLGDIWDSWIIPHDVQPPTMAELMQLGPAAKVSASIARLSEWVETVYVSGNHDIAVDQTLLATVLPKVKWGGNAFTQGHLVAEHGHMHALFCSPDSGAPQSLPVGYFVSRLAATADRKTGGHTPTRQQIVQELRDMATKNEWLTEAMLDAVAARAQVGQDEPILMPADLWGGAPTSVAKVKQVYAGLLTRWGKQHGVAASAVAIPAEVGRLDLAADIVMLKGARTVIMGHTHDPQRRETLGTLYVNTGCWSNNSVATWVEVEGGKVTGRSKH